MVAEGSKLLCKCKFSKKLKGIELFEKKHGSLISAKIICKLLSEFNMMTKIAPKPIQYNKLRPKKTKKLGGVVTALKRTEIIYMNDLFEMLNFLGKVDHPDKNLNRSKLYTLIKRILLISDQDNPEAVDLRTKSFK